MPNTAPELELDAYLRLNRASIAEWLAAIRELSGCDDIDCSLFEGSGHQVGALSTLTTERGRLICLYAAEGMEITGCRATEPVFLLPRALFPMQVTSVCQTTKSSSPAIFIGHPSFGMMRMPSGSRMSFSAT